MPKFASFYVSSLLSPNRVAILRWAIAPIATAIGLLSFMPATTASAGTVYAYLDTQAAYPNPLGGGPFTAHLSGNLPVGIENSVFTTFCIEYNEEFYPGSSHLYEIQFSDEAKFGTKGPPNGFDLLTTQTAWLYSQWRAGTLGKMVNDNAKPGDALWDSVGAPLKGDLYALQDAIWVTQGWNLSPNWEATPGLASELVNIANKKANGSLYDVQVMQMWGIGHVGDPNYRAQDQLAIIVPTPMAVGGGGVLLLGMCAFRLVKRSRLVD
jgi:hypothetical protein